MVSTLISVTTIIVDVVTAMKKREYGNVKVSGMIAGAVLPNLGFWGQPS